MSPKSPDFGESACRRQSLATSAAILKLLHGIGQFPDYQPGTTRYKSVWRRLEAKPAAAALRKTLDGDGRLVELRARLRRERTLRRLLGEEDNDLDGASDGSSESTPEEAKED